MRMDVALDWAGEKLDGASQAIVTTLAISISAVVMAALAGALLSLEHVESVRLRDEASIELETRDLAAFQEVFAPLAAEQRAGVVSVVSDDSSLEAVFDYLVG